ncbi:MAG TPA: MotA/TolQ/ExbB proton channel family protein [Candidatus Udaeobacter sp.]|nr:MotA/TolQ/ExbB proton channel family protein [Candidatus Udaeobacter sp.]
MKTSFIASACLLALVLTLVAQSPPPAQNPPGAPITSPAAQAPTNPAAINPAAPMQSPATNVPQGQQPAVPGASIPVTLSPAPGAVTSPAAAIATSPSPAASPTAEAQPTGFLAGNWLIDKFHKGGPVMWPILIVSIIALTVVIERCFWWGGRWFRRDPKRIEKVFTAIEEGDTTEASRLSRGSRDPVLRMMWNGLNHQHASLQGALQVAAGIEIKRAGRFLVVMDTLVTLAPLLGLLGTITGLIRSFSFLGNEELAVQAVTGGIAEALIATACGLGIAIFALIPFNFFTSRVSNLEFELQTAATNLEVMLEAQQKEPREHRGVEIEHGTPASATRSSI